MLCAISTDAASAKCSGDIFNACADADHADDAPTDATTDATTDASNAVHDGVLHAVTHDDVRRGHSRHAIANGPTSNATHGIWPPGDSTLYGGRTDAWLDVVMEEMFSMKTFSHGRSELHWLAFSLI